MAGVSSRRGARERGTLGHMPPPKDATIRLRIPSALHAAIARRAEAEGTTMSALIRPLLIDLAAGHLTADEREQLLGELAPIARPRKQR